MKKLLVAVLTVALIFVGFSLTSEAATKTGWVKSNGHWYYYSKSSQSKGWLSVKGKWYYFNSNGVMATGWIKYRNHWYSLNFSGAMLTGWQTIKGKTYFFYSSGEMASNTTIDGKKLGSDGAVMESQNLPDDGWVAPVLKSAWSPNPATNFATLQNELGFTDGGRFYNIDLEPHAIVVNGDDGANEVTFKFYGWIDNEIPQSYRIPIVAKELFKLYFGNDATRVWNYFNDNDIPDQFTANGRLCKATFIETDGSIYLQVGKKQ